MANNIVSFDEYRKNGRAAFPSNKQRSKEVESVTLEDWIRMHPDEDDLRTVFLNMDRAMRYIHEHGYCIEKFHPSVIEILNNEADHVQFKLLMELSKNEMTARQMIQEDIFRSALIQLATYLKISNISYLNPNFLRENFDQVAQFLPQGDVPYYRGVIQRGASVYFCEFALERRKHDLEELERQLGEEGESDSSTVDLDESTDDMVNRKVNDVIYKQINGLKEAAFVNLLLIPTISIAVLFLIGIILWIFSLF